MSLMSQAHPEGLLLKKPFWFYVKTYPRPVALGLSFLLITNGLDAVWPLILKEAIEKLEARAAMSELGRVCALFLTVLITLALTRYAWRRFFGEFHTFAAEHLRQKIFSHFNTLTSRFFQKTNVGELMSLITSDVQSFRQAVGPGFLIFADGIIIMSYVLPIMFFLQPSWTWKTLIFLPLLPFLIWKVMKWIHETYKSSQDKYAELTGFCHETVSGIRVVKGFAREGDRARDFGILNERYVKASNKNSLVDSLFSPVMEFGVASGSVILLFVSQQDVVSGAVSLGTFVAFHRYISKMVWPMTALGFGLSFVQKGRASFDRIREVLRTEPDIKDEGKIELRDFESLEFCNVSYRHSSTSSDLRDSKSGLFNLNFKIRKGDRLAIMGKIGSGKSTLFQLLCRMAEPQEGQILVNDRPIQDYTLRSLRHVFVYVPQEPFLYSRSVKENLLMDEGSLDPEYLAHAAESSQVLHEISSLPQSWESQLGEKGVNLSGGQKQRLTLARALMRPGQVFIFDDVLSAVDVHTEELIQKRLFNFRKEATLFVSAHRLSTVRDLDLVLVLNQGHLEYFGPWSQSQSSPVLEELKKLQSVEAQP